MTRTLQRERTGYRLLRLIRCVPCGDRWIAGTALRRCGCGHSLARLATDHLILGGPSRAYRYDDSTGTWNALDGTAPGIVRPSVVA